MFLVAVHVNEVPGNFKFQRRHLLILFLPRLGFFVSVCDVLQSKLNTRWSGLWLSSVVLLDALHLLLKGRQGTGEVLQARLDRTVHVGLRRSEEATRLRRSEEATRLRNTVHGGLVRTDHHWLHGTEYSAWLRSCHHVRVRRSKHVGIVETRLRLE